MLMLLSARRRILKKGDGKNRFCIYSTSLQFIDNYLLRYGKRAGRNAYYAYASQGSRRAHTHIFFFRPRGTIMTISSLVVVVAVVLDCYSILSTLMNEPGVKVARCFELLFGDADFCFRTRNIVLTCDTHTSTLTIFGMSEPVEEIEGKKKHAIQRRKPGEKISIFKFDGCLIRK